MSFFCFQNAHGNKSRTKLFKNIFSLLILQVSNYIAPLLVLPYLGRVLGLEGFGYIAMILSLCSVLNLIVDYGFNNSGVPYVANNIGNKSNVAKLITSVLFIRLCIVSLVVLVIYSVKSEVDVIHFTNELIFYIFLSLLGQSLQTIYFFQGIEKMKLMTYAIVSSKLFYLIMVFILVKSDSDANKVILSLGISSLLGGVISFGLVFKEGYGFCKVNFKELLSQVKLSFPFFISRAAVVIYTSASVLIVGGYGGRIQAGFYGSSEKLYQAAQSATSPLMSALYPYLVKNKDYSFFFKLIFSILTLISIVSVFCIYFSSEILVLIFGVEFQSASNIFSVFMLIVPITFLSMNFGYPAFALIDKIKVANISVLIGSFCHVILLIFLYYTNSINAFNVVCCLFFTESIVCFIRVSVFFRYYRKLPQS